MPGTIIPYNRINLHLTPADVLVLALEKRCHEETFVVTDAYCVEPGCDCNLATLRLSELMEDDTPDPEPIDFHLHLETLELLDLKGAPLVLEEGALLDNFRKNLPAEGLTLWRKHAAEARAWGLEHAWETADFSGIEPGEMLTPGRLWPDSPLVRVRLGDTVYEGADYYCPSPTCDCQEARLDLYPEGIEDIEAPGVPNVALRWEFRGRVVLEEVQGIPEREASPLVKALAKDKQTLALLKERYSKIKAAGKQLAARYPSLAQAWGIRSTAKPAAVSPTKVGRNDACPCGSGKKFKQCCGK